MFLKNDSDRDWEMWAKENPFYGVLSAPEFLKENLNDASIQQFFLSGERHVDHVYSVVRQKIDPKFQPARVLDYGSGVGRIVIPLARRSEVAFGVDVSSSMLKLSRENCETAGLTCAQFIHANDLSTIPSGSLDFVHSCLVFQHIPTGRGENIFRKLISLLAKGGVGSIHFNYADTRSMLRQTIARARRNSDMLHRLLNMMLGRSASAPMMQMNNYSINHILNILVDEECQISCVELAKDGCYRGATFYFQKN